MITSNDLYYERARAATRCQDHHLACALIAVMRTTTSYHIENRELLIFEIRDTVAAITITNHDAYQTIILPTQHFLLQIYNEDRVTLRRLAASCSSGSGQPQDHRNHSK